VAAARLETVLTLFLALSRQQAVVQARRATQALRPMVVQAAAARMVLMLVEQAQAVKEMTAVLEAAAAYLAAAAAAALGASAPIHRQTQMAA
jgi:hypothetical protein